MSRNSDTRGTQGRQDDDPEAVQVGVRVPVTMHRQIKRAAFERGESVAELVRRACARELQCLAELGQ